MNIGAPNAVQEDTHKNKILRGKLMKEIKVICPKCGNCITYKNYWSWVWYTPIHWFNYRRTKCTKCGEISYISKKRKDNINA